MFDLSKEVTESKEVGGGNFVQKNLEPGIHKVTIMDFEVKIASTGKFKVNALVETAPVEAIGDKGFKYDGVGGEHVAKGLFGRVALNNIWFDFDIKSMVQEIGNDLIQFGTKTGTIDELSKIEMSTTGNPQDDLEKNLKKVAKVLRGAYFYASINSEQYINGKGYPADNMYFNKGFIKNESGEKVRHEGTKIYLNTAASAHSVEAIKEVIIIDTPTEEGFNLIDINDKTISTWRKNKDKTDSWNFKWAEQPDTDEDDVDLGDMPDLDDDLGGI